MDTRDKMDIIFDQALHQRKYLTKTLEKYSTSLIKMQVKIHMDDILYLTGLGKNIK